MKLLAILITVLTFNNISINSAKLISELLTAGVRVSYDGVHQVDGSLNFTGCGGALCKSFTPGNLTVTLTNDTQANINSVNTTVANHVP